MMRQGHIQFKPRTALYIIHHRLRYLLKQKHYSEAYLLIEEEYQRHEDLRKNDLVTYAELLDQRAYVAGRWGDYLEAQAEWEKAFRLRQEAVHIHLQCSDWLCTQHLFAVPNTCEMELAMRSLAQLLRRGLRNSSTSDLALQIIKQTQSWSINPMSLIETEQELEQPIEEQPLLMAKVHKYFAPKTVQRFFEDVFQHYQFAWTVVRDSSTDHPRVSLTDKQLILPENVQISSSKIREILAHEVEMHIFRSVAGEKSRLLLLSLGLANFLETEEGLAIYCSMEAARFGASKPDKTWAGTLAIGLAAGVVCSPFSFHSLRSFLINTFTLRGLLAAKKTRDEIQSDALKNAHKRCLRTWRGVSNLSTPGICATKDSVYLRGYLAVCHKLQQEPIAFDRLLLGAVGLQHLDALGELGITEPHARHQRLAYDADLEVYVAQFADENTAE